MGEMGLSSGDNLPWIGVKKIQNYSEFSWLLLENISSQLDELLESFSEIWKIIVSLDTPH
jgi:hypothetical protein